MKKKDIEEYQLKYGEIPNNFFERFNYMIKNLKIKDKEIEKLKEGVKKLLKAKWQQLNFVIYFTPQSTPRPRSGRNGIFYVKGAADNSKAFKDFITNSEHEFEIITTATRFIVDVYLPIPTGMNRIEKILAELKLIRPIVKPDWDNIGKTYSDMIQKHLLMEDCTIIDGRTRKFYSAKPRVEIHLEYMTKYDCKFHKKKIENWKTYVELVDKINEKDSII